MVVRIDVKPTYFRVYLEASPGKLIPVPVTPCIGNVEQRYILPIAVAMEHDGSIRIGYDAMQRRNRAVGYCGAELRQYLTENRPVRLGRCEIPAKELFKMLFVQMKACAEMMDESYIEEIYLIFSADYNPAERESLIKVIEKEVRYCTVEEAKTLFEAIEPLTGSDADKNHTLTHYYETGQRWEWHANCYDESSMKYYREAAKCYRSAALHGYAKAQYALGVYYEKRLKLFLAKEWYRKAAEQGHEEAPGKLKLLENPTHTVCNMYLEEEYEDELPIKYTGRIEPWCYLAACNGDSEAQWRLGDMFYQGGWLEQNRSLTKKWYQRAAAQGNEWAINKLRTGHFE